MESVSVRVFRARLADYAELALGGEQIVVRRRGKPVALLRASKPHERTVEIGTRQLRASLGRALRATDHGRTWSVTFHGKPQQLILSPVPDGLVTAASDEEDWA